MRRVFVLLSLRLLVSASTAAAFQGTVTWQAPVGGPALTGYQYQRCEGQGCTPIDVMGAVVGPAVLTFVDASMVPNTSYCVAVVALNAGTAYQARSVPTSPVCAVGPVILPVPPGATSVTISFQ